MTELAALITLTNLGPIYSLRGSYPQGMYTHTLTFVINHVVREVEMSEYTLSIVLQSCGESHQVLPGVNNAWIR